MTPAIRLKPGESSDSGFCSSPALTTQVLIWFYFSFSYCLLHCILTHLFVFLMVSIIWCWLSVSLGYYYPMVMENSNTYLLQLKASTTTNQTHAVSTWPPHSQDPVTSLDRPHTISTAYEKGHQRPPLTVYTFQNPDGSASTEQHPVQKSPANVACRPPLPVVSILIHRRLWENTDSFVCFQRCSSLERPLSSTAGARNQTMHNMRQSPSPLPAHITKGNRELAIAWNAPMAWLNSQRKWINLIYTDAVVSMN